MEQPGPAAQKASTQRFEQRLKEIDRRLGHIEARLSRLMKGLVLAFTLLFGLLGWGWFNLDADIDSVRAELGGVRTELGADINVRTELGARVDGVQAAVASVEHTLGQRVSGVEREIGQLEIRLGERIHGLELAFTRAGIELSPLAPRQHALQEQP